jgi:DNA adenine methylase
MTKSLSRYLSPLRYPGGKAKLAAFVGELISAQKPRPSRYVEPFAGGGGVGLRLLFEERVDEIVLNDLNPGIAAFWRALFNDPAGMIELIQERPVTVDEWRLQRATYESRDAPDLQLGFATLFLNRTNRSGILKARPIGGLDQTGNWKIDARYNADALADRVRLLSRYATRVTITEGDGVSLVGSELRDPKSFVYADPPYLVQGDRLYLDAMTAADHQRLADILRAAPNRWLLTYDADARITSELYAGNRCAEFSMAHSAGPQRTGLEYAVFPDNLAVPSLASLGHGEARWLIEN